MNLDPIKPYLDAIRAFAFVAVMCGTFVVGFQRGEREGEAKVQAAEAKARVQRAEDQSAAAQSQARAVQAARAAERAEAAQQAAVAAQLIEDNAHALQARDRTIAALRTGHLRLRERFACRVPAAPAVPGGSDAQAAGGLQSADAEFLVRFAADADDTARQLAACQALSPKD